ncbi:conserved hypothetical protein [Theileria orientalis strain Shintoku]|uniref:Serine aminopeptidase S33 domain-containing protein n=1 Tax=Theileria orientalis strain Shintoku TaxID=869250 RepID=J7MF12_THEOR|nr:conserved hypothetical protein [Theileria orientalis strain Shintoku]BAM42359.1 conserved hypothetical protein [Theileria orientalis strain Shintoku]|eukprot:XP_009692660.1 conserved hypothetical protein [Theileria orientalis strain Shintoku]
MFHAKAYAILCVIIKCVEAGEGAGLAEGRHEGGLERRRLDYTPVEIDLDAKVDENEVEYLKVRPYDIDIRHYNLREGYSLARVSKSEQEIWNNYRDQECANVSVAYQADAPLLMCVNCVNSSGGDEHYYLVNENGRWLGLRDRSFYAVFNRFFLETTVSRTTDLNLQAELREDDFYVNRSPDFPFTVVVPNVSLLVNRLYSGNDLIWESPSTRLLYVSLFKNAEKPLICLITSSLTLFFVNEGRRWREISESEYACVLRELGVDLASFDNSVGLDVSSPDSERFLVTSFGSDLVYFRKCSPRPGLRLTIVRDSQAPSRHGHEAGNLVWSSPPSSSDHCVYVGINIMDGVPSLMNLYIKNHRGDHRVEYFVRVHDGSWASITESEYFYVMENNKMPAESPKRINPALLRSHFRNKQGLLIQTYCSRAQNTEDQGPEAPNDQPANGDGPHTHAHKSRGAFILVHGNREYFVSNFLNSETLWNFKNFGYPAFPTINAFDELFSPNLSRPSHSGSNALNNQNVPPSLVETPLGLQRFHYECSLVGALNEMGFDVYGMDMQSFGLSESVSGSRCYVDRFDDLVDDLLQFVDIVKRGKFSDKGQSWYPDVFSMGTELLNDNLFLLGYSMGANVVLQAAQKFNRDTEGPFNFVNGIVSLSGMIDMDKNFSNVFDKTFSMMALNVLNAVVPHAETNKGSYDDWTKKMSDYQKLCDGFYFSKNYSFRTIHEMFKATKNLKSGMRYYPGNMPTLFVHCEKDPVCSIEGPKKIYHEYIKNNPYSEFIELKGNSHETPSPLFMYNFLNELRAWIGVVSSHKQPTPPRSGPIGKSSVWNMIEIVLYVLIGSVLKTILIVLVLKYRKKKKRNVERLVDNVDCIVH